MSSSTTDHVPLLDRSGNAHDEQPDARFTIDDEEGEGYIAHGGQVDDGEGLGDAAEQSSGPSSSAYKYPPSAPPPSYREATGESKVTYHVLQCLRHVSKPNFASLGRFSSKAWSLICRCWPTSRFSQLGLFMVGLWLLVILSGPAFDDAGPRAGAGYPWVGIEALSEDGPGPISGDGHVIANANWTMKSCVSSPEHDGEVLCTSTTRISLDVPTNFHTTDSIFVYADPPRTNHLTDGRGSVPGTVEVVLVKAGSLPDQTPAGTASVIIDAEYEQSRGEVFERSTVAKMAAGNSVSQGVGIYTYPLPPQYAKRHPPPLKMHVKILIPEGAVIPALKIQASGMSVGAFAEPLVDAVSVAQRRSLSPSQKGKEDKLIVRRKRAPTTPQALLPVKFGRLIMETGTSSVRIGKNVPIRAVGLIKCTTYNGNVVIEGDLHSAEVRLETMTGNVRIEKDSHVMAWRESRVASQTGNIELKEGSTYFSSQLQVKTNNGLILGGGQADANRAAGLWKTNQTLEMQTFNGAIHASYVVLKPTDTFLNPQQLVRLETESKNGNVDVTVVEQEPRTVVHAKMSTGVGLVDVHMHRNFVGAWEIDGSRGGSMVVGPSSDDARAFHADEPEHSMMKFRQKGSIGNQDDDTAKKSKVNLHSSLGAAKLSFA